jgi:hypothetical protein
VKESGSSLTSIDVVRLPLASAALASPRMPITKRHGSIAMKYRTAFAVFALSTMALPPPHSSRPIGDRVKIG